MRNLIVGQVDLDTGPIAAGGTAVLLDSDNYRHLGGVPLAVKLHITGGALERGLSPSPDYPGEIRLRTWQGGVTGQPRVWLAPGGNSGSLFLCFNLPRNYQGAAASATRWYIDFVNPAGSLATKTIQVQGEVVAGHVVEQWDYEHSAVWSTSGWLANRYYADLCFTVPGTLTPSARIMNGATGQTLSVQQWSYAPTAQGGPNTQASPTITVTPSNFTTVALTGARHAVYRAFFAIAPGASTIQLAVGVGHS